MSPFIKKPRGNILKAISSLGASNHSKTDRVAYDFYATPPYATEKMLLLPEIHLDSSRDKPILDAGCGMGHISKVLLAHGHFVQSTDLIYRGYGQRQQQDFFEYTQWPGSIVNNPPFSIAHKWAEHGLSIIDYGKTMLLFMKIQFLETPSRADFLEANPPRAVFISRKRINCWANGDEMLADKSSTMCFCWYYWVKGYRGDTAIRWFN